MDFLLFRWGSQRDVLVKVILEDHGIKKTGSASEQDMEGCSFFNVATSFTI